MQAPHEHQALEADRQIFTYSNEALRELVTAGGCVAEDDEPHPHCYCGNPDATPIPSATARQAYRYACASCQAIDAYYADRAPRHHHPATTLPNQP